MDFLVSGFQKYVFRIDLEPSFRRRGYTEVNYHLIPSIDKAQQLIDSRTRLDLPVLGGASAEDFETLNARIGLEHRRYAEFAKFNSKIPSILIVESVLQGTIRELGKIHPPNCICYWFEFGDMPREKLDAIIRGENINFD